MDPRRVQILRPRVECSTPFGITDEWTSEGLALVLFGLGVLNAFRHHG